MGYAVAINDPYKGVELVRKHGRPAERRHSLQIEINRRLYMNEATLEKSSGFAALQADLARLAFGAFAMRSDSSRLSCFIHRRRHETVACSKRFPREDRDMPIRA